jgi:hypothetical protein
MEKGSLFRKAFLNGLGPLKKIAFQHLYSGRYQIRFDSS